MPRFAANLSLMFTEVPFLDRFAMAAAAGFKGVEFLFPFAFATDDLRARLDDNGLELVLFNLPPGHWDKGERGYTAVPGRENDFAHAVDLALRYAEALGCSRLHAMAGLKEHGAERSAYIANLKLAAAWAEPLGIDILIEPINTRDMPGYFLNRTSVALDVLRAVDAPNAGLQFDLYHRQIMEGDLAAAVAAYGPIARHVQCANPPDRGEPDKGEIDYSDIFRRLDDSGYAGWIGCEYKPRGDTRAGLVWADRCGVRLG